MTSDEKAKPKRKRPPKDEGVTAFVAAVRKEITACRKGGAALHLTGEEWARRVTRQAEELVQGVDPEPGASAAFDELSPDEIREQAVRLAAQAYVLAEVDESEQGADETPEADDAPVMESEAA